MRIGHHYDHDQWLSWSLWSMMIDDQSWSWWFWGGKGWGYFTVMIIMVVCPTLDTSGSLIFSHLLGVLVKQNSERNFLCEFLFSFGSLPLDGVSIHTPNCTRVQNVTNWIYNKAFIPGEECTMHSLKVAEGDDIPQLKKNAHKMKMPCLTFHLRFPMMPCLHLLLKMWCSSDATSLSLLGLFSNLKL